MKRWGWVFVLVLAVCPAWAAKNLTVQQLADLLASLKKAQKTDAEVAAQLQDVELKEELSRSMMNSLASDVPGQLTIEQIFVLQARSAMLAPPASSLPVMPPPDAPAQKAILDKTFDYVSKTFKELPAVTASKATRRFQDNAEMPQGSFGAHSSASLEPATLPIRYGGGTETTVTFQGGAEQMPADKDKTQWGANGMIALLGQGPVLSTVMDEAQAGGKIAWVRWQEVNGKPAAVFSFAVDKKKTRYEVSYCCFPDTDQAGPIAMRGTAGGGASGNYAVNTKWKPFKATVPYHGEMFVDPETGVISRLIFQAEFKSSEWVRQEDQRIDFDATTVAGKSLMLPTRSVILTLELPFGDMGKGQFVLRHTLFTSEYKDYQAGS
jgi:hypothetical protein